MDMLQGFFLFRPVHGQHLFIIHLAQKALNVYRQQSFARQVFDDVQRKVVSQQTAQMNNPGVDVPQTFHCKRIGLCRDTLRTFVLIFSVYIFKADGMGAGQSFHFDAFFPYIFRYAHVGVGQSRNQ